MGDAIKTEVGYLEQDDNYPEKELYRAIIRQALHEATYRKIIITYETKPEPKKIIKFLRNEQAVFDLLNTKIDKQGLNTEIICDYIGLPYQLIKQYLKRNFSEYENITTIDITCYIGKKGFWLIKDDYKINHFGIKIDVNKIYDNIFGGIK
jgi:hypothetical protein